MSFSGGTWSFFVIQGGREAYIELDPRGDLVEVSFELTRPKKEPKREEEPAPQQQTPAPRPVPAPVYDDDYGEEFEGDDDFEGGED